MKDKLTLTKHETGLINFFIWDHLKLDTGATRARSKWEQPGQSMCKGGRGWSRIEQGGTGIYRLLYWYQNIYKPGSKEWRPAIIIRAALAVCKSFNSYWSA